MGSTSGGVNLPKELVPHTGINIQKYEGKERSYSDLLKPKNFSSSKTFNSRYGHKDQMRPSCPRVKVEVNLIAKLPTKVMINKENKVTGAIRSKWVSVPYDYMPNYWKECSLQGHDKETYWNVHLKLFGSTHKEKHVQTKDINQGLNNTQNKADGGNKNNKQQRLQRRSKYKQDKYGHIVGEVDQD
ncbi:hypothetical protein FXO37_28191 [Capsicum annuum]|nr:hypothetical protein FXO37_28191 [Capsicum annuum]